MFHNTETEAWAKKWRTIESTPENIIKLSRLTSAAEKVCETMYKAED